MMMLMSLLSSFPIRVRLETANVRSGRQTGGSFLLNLQISPCQMYLKLQFFNFLPSRLFL
jgi:hypothetical protein